MSAPRSDTRARPRGVRPTWRSCGPAAKSCARHWQTSAQWPNATAVLRPATARLAISRLARISRRSIISVKCRGANFPPLPNGTCASNRGRRFAPCSPTACPASRLSPIMQTSMPEGDARERIRMRGLELGFDVVRFARAALPESARGGLRQFLADGRHGDMTWLNGERRKSLAVLWPEARSAIVVGMNYGPTSAPLNESSDARAGAISVYAQGDDYHDVIKGKLKQLAQFVAHAFSGDVKVLVDTAPVMEKPLAQEAGAGWQGKH